MLSKKKKHQNAFIFIGNIELFMLNPFDIQPISWFLKPKF